LRPDEILGRIARAAGLPENALASGNPDRTADEIGQFLRIVVRNLQQLLATRAETKGAIRSSNRTVVRAVDNNPLKFAVSPEEALRIMFSAGTPGYLDSKATLEQSFADLKSHQMHTFAAMQSALEALFEELAPDKIEASVPPERGIGGLVGSRKAKLWDAFTERWKAKSGRSDGRLVDAYTMLFGESYDRLQNKSGR
jgi:type VI secretion system protein ImpI